MKKLIQLDVHNRFKVNGSDSVYSRTSLGADGFILIRDVRKGTTRLLHEETDVTPVRSRLADEWKGVAGVGPDTSSYRDRPARRLSSLFDIDRPATPPYDEVASAPRRITPVKPKVERMPIGRVSYGAPFRFEEGGDLYLTTHTCKVDRGDDVDGLVLASVDGYGVRVQGGIEAEVFVECGVDVMDPAKFNTNMPSLGHTVHRVNRVAPPVKPKEPENGIRNDAEFRGRVADFWEDFIKVLHTRTHEEPMDAKEREEAETWERIVDKLTSLWGEFDAGAKMPGIRIILGKKQKAQLNRKGQSWGAHTHCGKSVRLGYDDRTGLANSVVWLQGDEAVGTALISYSRIGDHHVVTL